MYTITQALNRGSDSLEIRCKVVCIKVFFTESSVYSTALLVDQDGKTIEAKSWTANKSYYVYFNFQTNQSVTLKCSSDCINACIDESYTGADFQATGRPWFLFNLTTGLRLNRSFPVFSEIEEFHNAPAKAKSLIGEFIEIGYGPLKYGTNRKLLAKGRFVTLKDANNLTFKALVWANARRKFKFPLDDCNAGDLILLPYAREQHEQYRSRSYYIVTTTYPPVVAPKTVNPSKMAMMNSDERSKIFYPYN